MIIEQTELERDMVPIADRCYRGCGARAIVVEGCSAFCGRCFLAMLKAEIIRRSTVAA
jgi:hypothetical protein